MIAVTEIDQTGGQGSETPVTAPIRLRGDQAVAPADARSGEVSTATPRPNRWNSFANLLRDVRAFIGRYVVLTDEQAIAVALWIAHTHAIDAADCTPYLQITSLTKRAGKTRLLETLEPLVARPWLTGRVSAAALVRKVDGHKPTLLLDESDAAFQGEKEYAEALRGLLNSGYRRSGRTSICVGQGAAITVRDFATFGAKAIAGIGELPGTIADRSIRIALRRRAECEPIQRWRERYGHAEAAPLNQALIGWAASERIIEALREAQPELPPGLGDRQADVWEPLLAIAKVAGADWPERARWAATSLAGSVEDSDVNIELLHDIYAVFEEIGAAFILSTDLATSLAALDSRPWGEWKNGKPMTPRALADRLKTFGILPRPNEKGTARGYARDRFQDVWSRYPVSKGSNRQVANEIGADRASQTVKFDSAFDTSKVQLFQTNPGLSDKLTLPMPNRENYGHDGRSEPFDGDGDQDAGIV